MEIKRTGYFGLINNWTSQRTGQQMAKLFEINGLAFQRLVLCFGPGEGHAVLTKRLHKSSVAEPRAGTTPLVGSLQPGTVLPYPQCVHRRLSSHPPYLQPKAVGEKGLQHGPFHGCET